MNDKGSLEFLWNHGVISDEGWANIRENCTFTSKDDWQCFVASRKPRIGNIDLHNIYAPICLKSERDGTYHSSGYVRSHR